VGRNAFPGWDATTWIADPRKIPREMGCAASVNLQEGLKVTLSWIRADWLLGVRYEADSYG
jgi:hypothetical protein